jgi:hypothetical protein
MKKSIALTFSFFMASISNLSAQSTFPISVAGFNTTTPDADLRIDNTYSVDPGCNITGIPALKILRTDFSSVCAGIAPIGPSIVEIQRNFYNTFTNAMQLEPVMMVNGRGNLGLGINPIANTRLSVAGRSNFSSDAYFGNFVQVKNKFRVNNTTLNASDWTAANFPYSFSVDQGDSRFLGKVQISNPITATNPTAKKPVTTAYNNYMLAVEGNIVCQKAIVQISDWADYVFAKDYKLMPLGELEQSIKTNKHLPEMPNAETVVNEGQDVGEIQKMQQAKIEELTLYILQLRKDLDEVKGLINK